jgi:hypothetical protein
MPPEMSPASMLLDDPEWEAQSITAEAEQPEQPAVEQPEEEVPAGTEETETEETETEEEESGEDEDEGEEEVGEDGEPAEVDAVSADPEVKAFLSKYGNDPEKALKGAAELSRLLGRQARDLTKANDENAQLRAALMEAQAVSAGLGVPLNEPQREWVEQAAQSVNPAMFAKQAVDQGEFELARAVCREWALTSPYDALQVGEWINQVQSATYQAANQAPVVSTDQVIQALDEAMPEMRAYYGQMTQIVAKLGDTHPLVAESRSTDPEEAMRGLIGLYEIARASTATVNDAQAEVKKRKRREADDERAKGLVSSRSNSPSVTETPRSRLLMPGLTQEALDTEFAAQAGR